MTVAEPMARYRSRLHVIRITYERAAAVPKPGIDPGGRRLFQSWLCFLEWGWPGRSCHCRIESGPSFFQGTPGSGWGRRWDR